MSFRPRLIICFGVVVLVPLLAFGLGIRDAMWRRITGEYELRALALVDVSRAEIGRENARIASRLAARKGSLAGDNQFRGMVLRGETSAYVRDCATDAMRRAGLGFLQIQDDEGRVVSSGHFRNEFGRLGPAIPPGEGTDSLTLVRAAAAEGPFLALVTTDTLSIARRPFRLVGGIVVDSSFLLRLARDPELGVALALPRDSTSSDSGKLVVGPPLTPPYIDATDGPGRAEQAPIATTRAAALCTALQPDVNPW